MAEETILIIEDDYDVAVMMDSLVRELGYRPVVAYDGQSGLELARQERPDLILLDLRLPRMSGVELLSKLHENQLNLPVVVVTALGSEELALHALRMGVKDYVKKPFDPRELLEAIERALEEGRLRRENARLVQSLTESRDQIAERSADLKTVLSKLVRLQRIALALSTLTIGTELREVYARLTEYAAKLLEVQRSAILLFDSQRQELVCQEPTFGLSSEMVSGFRIPLTPDSPIWDAWEKGQSLIANDLTESPLLDVLGLNRHVSRDGVRSTMFSALRLGGRSIGLFQVSDRLDGGDFTPDDLRVLEIFASQSAVAIENARLFTNEKRRASEMETLVQIAQAVTEAVTERPQGLLERIARGACEVLHADSAVVYPFITGEPNIYDVPNVAGFGTLLPLNPVREVHADDPVHSVRQCNLLVSEDITRDRPGLAQHPFFEREFVRAVVGVMLEADETELGVLYVNYRTCHSFSEHELTSVRLIAHQAALVIAKSRLFQTLNRDLLITNSSLRRKLRETEELQKISYLISSTPEICQVFDEILKSATSLTGAPTAGIITVNQEGTAVQSYVRRDGETISERIDPRETATLSTVDHSGQPTIVQDVTVPSVNRTPWLSIYQRLMPKACALVNVPITSGSEKKPLGHLGIGSPEPGEFGPDELRLLAVLANQAAIAIQNARYFETVRLYREQQVEAERIAAMADVAGNMVHRINNTVGAIRPLIQQIEIKMARGELDEAYLRAKLEGIRLSADRALDVARQIRRPFRSVPLEAIDVNESIAAAWADLRAPVGVKVKFDCADNLPSVTATCQLDEVFRNLIKNAFDAMADMGGLLFLCSRQRDDHRVEVVVRDTGPGIPPEIRDKIFQIGATSKPGGTGFGLWWSRTFLRRLGGDIELGKADGKGCAFRVLLPTSEAKAARNVDSPGCKL
jgi:GAF domain-containing protein/CheY-like chemotaxis protein